MTFKIKSYKKTFLENNNKIPSRIDLEKDDILILEYGRFVIEKKLGRGGFGSVYEILLVNGNKNKSEQKFAIKILDLWRIKPNEYGVLKKRFQREFKAGQISAENIVRSYSIGYVEGNPYIIMELCTGGSLAERLLEFYKEDDFSTLAIQILNGLKDLHNQKMIHRDIKPENIIFKDKHIAKLTDFGIMGDLENRMTKVNWLGSAKEIWGTPLYSAPEQLNKRNAYKLAGPSMDIFSFGVTLFEVISSGQLPFGTTQEINQNPLLYTERVKKGEYDSINKYRQDISPIWKNIIDKSLQPKIEDRYKNVEEIIHIIESEKKRISSKKNHGFSNERTLGKKIETNSNYILKILNINDNKSFDLTRLLKKKKNSLLTIGRYDETILKKSDIQINEIFGMHISRKHATFEFENNNWYLRDGQWDGKNSWIPSKNGTYVNNNKIDFYTGAHLKFGDVIKMGDITFEILNK